MSKLYALLITFIIIACGVLRAGDNDDLLFAMGLYEDGNFALAEQELEKYLASYPDSNFRGEASYLLADIYLNQAKYKSASELFKALRDNPPATLQFSDILFGQGQSYYYLKNYPEAKKIFKELLKKYPQHRDISRFYYFLGCCQFAELDLKTARTNLQKSLELEDKMTTRLKLVEVYLADSDPDSAEKLIKSALDKFAGDENLYYSLVLFQGDNIKRGKYDKLLTIGYDKVPANSDYYEQYNLLTGIAQFEKANYQEAVKRLESLQFEKAQYYYALSLIKLNNRETATAVLRNLQTAENKEIMANSLFYLADLESEPIKKNKLFEEFINKYPENMFVAEARYLWGYNQFRQQKYEEAADNIQKSISAGLTAEYLERAIYLQAEAAYLSEKPVNAQQLFTAYLNKYPAGKFADEAYFKKGLCLFTAGNNPAAKEEFQLVIYNFPESDKIGMSNFYLGEIALLSKDYEKARQHYSIALNQRSDKNLVWLRISRSWQQTKDYSKAAAALENVDTGSAFEVEKLTLLGDIRFAEKNYIAALKSYQQASQLEKDTDRKESIQAKSAWTYYQKGDYNKASEIYNQLSIRTDNPATYTFQSATAMFSAKQYDTALRQYKLFVENFPSSLNAITAKIGIGDCYYNLKDFESARKQYRSLITLITDENLNKSILNGWKWSTEQSGKDFLAEISDFQKGNIPVNYRFMVEDYKAKYMFSHQMYQEVNDLVDQMKRNYNFPMKEAEYLKARSLKNLKLWDAADDFYARLFIIYKDPNLQFEWADITLATGNVETTVRKLQFACEKLEKPEHILKLLQVEIDYDWAEFDADYQRFIDKLKGAERENAELLRTKWFLDQNKIPEANQKIAALKNSAAEEIKAEAQYLSGYSLYQQKKYQEAVPELLRVRHLFPYLIEIRHRSEELAFRAYLKMDKKQDAVNLLNNIRADLSPSAVSELEKLLEGE